MSTNITAHVPGQSRGPQVKKIAYEMEKVFAEAQTEVSRVQPHSVFVSMDGGNYKLIARSKKRSYTVRNHGVRLTPDSGQTWRNPRALFITELDDALQIDIGDDIDNFVNITGTAREEQKKAMARTIDQVLLSAIGDYALEDNSASLTGDNAITDSTTARITAAPSLVKRYKDTFRAKWAANGNTLVAFEAEDFETINHVFLSRSIEDDLCVTLTPELALIMRKDSDFKNAENIYSLQSAPDRRMGFTYKNFKFIPIRPDVLPLLSTSNFSSEAAGTTVNAVKKCGARSLEDTESASTSRTEALKTTSIVGDTDYGEITVATKDVFYVWSPSKLVRSTRSELNLFSDDTRLDLSLARQIYSRINIGATYMDDDFTLAVALTGTVTKTKSATS